MPLIYRKTAKGIAEIETRAHRLPPRLRGALIMVDGKRGTPELRALLQAQADESLLALIEQGFIEAVQTSEPASGPAPAQAPRPSAPAMPPAAEFETLRRTAIRLLLDQTGPGGETLAVRMEKVRSLEDLRALLPAAARVIEAMRGKAAAAAYLERFPPSA